MQECACAYVQNMLNNFFLKKSLEKMTWHDEVLRLSINQTSLSKRNLVKNRFPELALGLE